MKRLSGIILLFIYLNAIATDYYVSNTGSDAANGLTTGTAWQTIAKVNSSSFLAGDHIYFKRGDMWREQLTLSSSGSAGNLITFGAYGSGAKPIINGADVKTGWTNAGSNQWWINNPNPTTTRAMVIIGSTIYREVASLGALASGKYFVDISATPDRIYVYSTVDPATLTAEVSAREYCIITAAGASSKKFIEIDDIEVRYAGRGGIYFEGPGSGVNDALNGSSIVRRCVAYANRFWGIIHIDHYDNLTVEDCDASYNGNGFYSWVADEGTFRRCTSSNNIYYAIAPGITDGGGIQGYQSDNWLVESCTSNFDADAIHLDAGGVSTNALIRYNKVYNSQNAAPVPTPCMGVGSVGVGGIVEFSYNLLVNGASAAFECYTTILGTVRFYNNTIYHNTSTATTDAIYLANASNFDIKNNLITKDWVSLRRVLQISPSINAPTINYNCYYAFNNAEHFRAYFNGNHTALSTWRTAIGGDANAINNDPLFVNNVSDWSLQAGSPCINAGVNVGLTEDILGNPIVGNPDIGAYEFTAPVSPVEVDSIDYDIRVRSDETLLNTTADQPIFTNPSHDSIYVKPNTTYDFDIVFDLTHLAAPHELDFGMIPKDATITNMFYDAIGWVTSAGVNTASQYTVRTKTTSTVRVIFIGSWGAETIKASGWFTVGNTGGYIVPSIQFSANPTGTILLKSGARFRMKEVGNDTFTKKGPIN